MLLLFVLTVCTLRASAAHAEVNLLWVRNLSMGMGGGYHFSGSSASADNGQSISSSKHAFSESFQISGDFSLLNPRFIQGSAGLNLGLSQLRGTDQGGLKQSSSDFNLGYEVSSVLFQEKPWPVHLDASSRLSTTNPPFSRSFDVNSDDFYVAASLGNRFLPVQLALAHNASQTSGLAEDRRQNTDTVTLNLKHADGAFSVTDLNLLNTKSESALLDSGVNTSQREVRATFRNDLNWQDERHLSRVLTSSYSYDGNEGFQHSTSQNISSNLRTQLGKALSAAAGYHFMASSTDNQTLQLQTGNLSLSHRLYDSLSTTLRATGGSSRFTDGEQDSYGGGGGVNYTYRLPSETQYSLSYDFSYSVADRRRSSVLAVVRNERHALPLTDPRRITLDNPAFQAETVTVRGAQTLTLYASGMDFVANGEGVEVRPGHMVGDTELLISYSYLQDPRVAFASIGHGMSGKLNLAGRQHSMYFNANSSEQKLLRGSATEVTLSPSYHLDIGYDYSMDRQTMHGEYGWNKSFASNLQYLDTRWSYQAPFRSGALTVSANDRFSWNMQSGINEGQWDNSLNLQSTYSAKISESIFGTAGLNYLNAINDTPGASASNFLSANVKLDGNFGKTTVTVSSNLSCSVSSSAASLSEAVGVSFHRSF